MMSAKMTTPGLLKIGVFWNKGYHVIFCRWRHQKLLSRDSNDMIDVAC